MSRCYGCCQENCGYTHCTCPCHDRIELKPKTMNTDDTAIPEPTVEADPAAKPIGHLNNPSGEIVRIARELYDKLRMDVTVAELRTAELRRELEEERAKTPDERLAIAGALIEALKEIADHHCANLDPEFIRDIPAARFAIAATYVDKAVGATQRDSERAEVWRARAKMVNDWKDRRGTPEWAALVAEYKVKQLQAQAQAEGYAIVPLPTGVSPARRTKTTKTKTKTKAKTKTRRVRGPKANLKRAQGPRRASKRKGDLKRRR